MKEKENFWIIEKLNQVCIEQDKMLDKIKVLSEVERFSGDLNLVNFYDLLDRLLFEFKQVIKQNQIEVVVDNKVNEGVFCAEILVYNSLKYLLENSFFFRNPRRSVVKITSQLKHQCLEILIEDNGLGIPEFYQDKIFDMYYRANENSKGNGLGLYVVRKSIEKIDGKIYFTSLVGFGSTFKLIVPIQN